jgi:hypothetical protein
VKNSRTRKPEPGKLISRYVRASETTSTHLANWPPPMRAKENKPVLVKHAPNEPVKRAKPRGWRLTRAIFSEFSDD